MFSEVYDQWASRERCVADALSLCGSWASCLCWCELLNCSLMGDPCYLDDDWRTVGYFSATANTFALCSPKTIHLLTEEHGKIWGRLKFVWWKSGVPEHKSGNISETRKRRGKVTMGGYIGTHLRSFERYHTWPPTASSSPRLGFATSTQNSNRY